MNKRTLSLILWSTLVGAAPGCFLDEVGCDSDQVARSNFCFQKPAVNGGEGGGEPDNEAGRAQGGSAPAVSTWGKPCETNDDCSGDSPVCAESPLFYCTNIDCTEGEPNAGICPDGWTCFPKGIRSPSDPSACVRQ